MHIFKPFIIITVLFLTSLNVKGQHFYGRYYIDVSEKIIGKSAHVLKDSLGYFLKDTTGIIQSKVVNTNYLLSYTCTVERYMDKSAVSIVVFLKFDQNNFCKEVVFSVFPEKFSELVLFLNGNFDKLRNEKEDSVIWHRVNENILFTYKNTDSNKTGEYFTFSTYKKML